jgi:signal transduction histidine kinase
MYEKESIAQRLSSSSLIAWPSFWLILVLSTIMTSLTSFGIFKAFFAEVLFSIIVSHMALFGVQLASYRLLSKTKIWRRGYLGVPTILIASALRGAVLAILLKILDVERTPQWGLRVGGSAIGNSVAVILIVLAVASIREHRERLTEYVARNIELTQIKDRLNFEINEAHQSEVEKIRTGLLSTISKAVAQSAPAFRDAMRKLANDVVRPMSHDLVKQPIEIPRINAEGYNTKIDWKTLVSDAANGRTLPAFKVSLTLIIIGAIWSFTVLEPRAAVIFLTSGFFGIWFFIAVGNAVLKRVVDKVSPIVRAILMSAMLLFIGGMTAATNFIDKTSGSEGAVSSIADLVLIPILGWLFAGATAAQHQRVRMEKDFADLNKALDWEITRARAIQWQQSNRLSRTLHGPIQGAIGGAAVRLDIALNAKEPTDHLQRELFGNIIDAIETLNSRELLGDRQEMITQLRKVYADLCEITFTEQTLATERLGNDAICAVAVTELIQEAVGNSIQHGKSRSVSAAVNLVEDGQLEVRVTDDGKPESASDQREGLGTKMLNAVSLRWSRNYCKDGTELVAVLPIT